ncbi:MAG: amidohydrolase family protein [Candidatus Aminicenantes bacterium]
MKKFLLFFIMTAFLTTAFPAAASIIAIKNGKIITSNLGVLEKGTIVIKDGKIHAVGPDIRVPDGARVISAENFIITPGLIDSHSHLGLGPSGGVTEDNEMSHPVTPQLRIIDSIHPEGVEPHRFSFRDAVTQGVTTIIARPGSGNVIGGQSAALKLSGKTVDDMILKSPCDMKMAMGKKSYYGSKGIMPVTKMGTAYLVRKAMVEAQEYRKAWERYREKTKKNPAAAPPPKDLKNEAMMKVLNRELPVHIHASPADDIMTAVRLGDEFDFEMLSIGHGNEAYKVADELAKRDVVVVVGPQMIVFDDDGQLINLADALHKHGVEVNIMTDADVVQQEFLRFQAAIAVKYGMDPLEALKAITINPARLIGMDHRIGSLEAGKDADVVIFDGDPFSLQTSVVKVFINGKEVFSCEGYNE